MANENVPPLAQKNQAPIPAPPGVTPGVPPQSGDPNQPAPAEDGAVQLSFWQLPWVQTILPFATSVLLGS